MSSPPRIRPAYGTPQGSFRPDRGSAAPARVRRGVLRVSQEAAYRLRAGHPLVFRDALGGRPVSQNAGDIVEVHASLGSSFSGPAAARSGDDTGFIGRGYYDPEGSIAVRLLSWDPGEILNASAYIRRVEAARALRERYLPESKDETQLSAYRVLHGEGDFLPGITVDRYGDFLVAHVFTGSLEPHLSAIYDALEAVWRPRGIYSQKRYRPLGGEGAREPAECVRGEVAPVEMLVREAGLGYGVDVTAPLGTGLFPDLRLGRARVRAQAKDRRVLNLFSYTGAISLCAAAGGAKEVVSVDLSAKAHARLRRNLVLSEMQEQGHEFITADAFPVLARMAERKRQFDLVVLDPPSFSQSRGTTFATQKDYPELVAAALSVCAEGALLYCGSNTARLPLEELEFAIGDGAARARRQVRIIERWGLPADFPVPAGFSDGHYLKFVGLAVI